MKTTIALLILLVLLMNPLMFAQNTDEATTFKSSQEIDYKTYEATIEAYRGTFVPGYTSQNATIDSAGSLSDSLDLLDSRVICFAFDTAWTAAGLTFQTWNALLSAWVNVYENDGTEYTYTVTDSVWVLGKPIDFAGIRYLKVRSGTSGTPVNQAFQRSVAVILRRY